MRRPIASACRTAGALWLIVLGLVILAQAQTLTFPALSGRVVDEAGILDSATRQSLTEKLAALETKTTDQLVVATVRSLQGTSVEDYANRLFREWRLGQQGKDNGVLMLVAPNERRVRIEVGYGLEGTLPDAVGKLIIENGVLPRFRANDFAGGITRGVDDVIQVLTGDAGEWKQRAAQRPKSQSPLLHGFVLFFVLFVIVMIVIAIYNSNARAAAPRSRYGRRGSSDPWWIPSGSGSSWSSGGSSWDSGSSGGFSGGGGSSGGGGASGSW